MMLWSGVGGQLLSHHVAVVRGCCHVGGQLRTRSLEEPFRGAFRKKRRFLFIKEVLIHSHFQQPFLAAILTSSSQLPFLPATFTAAILTSHFSAALLSSHSHQPLLSGSSQQPFSPASLITSLWSGVGGQLLSHHVAVVRGWWWTILVTLLRSGVGGQPFSSCCCGQGLMVSYSHHVWWSAILIMSLWSGVGGQLLSHHVAVARGWWSAIVTSCC